MRILEPVVKHGGFAFRQIAREGQVALFEKSKGRYVGWEVVIVQKWPERTWLDGTVSPPREAIPKDEQWGSLGWTCQTLERAWERFREALTLIEDGQTDSDGSTPRLLIRQEGSREGGVLSMRKTPLKSAKAEWEARPARDTDTEVTTPSGLNRLPRIRKVCVARKVGL